MSTPKTFDLATEVGESFSLPPCGLSLDILKSLKNSRGQSFHPRHTKPRNDAALLDIVSTAYVACSAHSGDPVVMLRTMRDLVTRGITVGAHPSYPDLFDFGQTRPEDLASEDLFAILVSQLASADALAHAAGTSIRTVKCHGALSFDVADSPDVTRTLARAMKHIWGTQVSLVIFAGASGIEAAQECGIHVLREAYVDRGYGRDGRILSRQLPGALIDNPEAALSQALAIILKGRVITIEGEEIEMQSDMLCLHGDTPGSGLMARMLEEELSKAGIMVGTPS